MGATSRAVTTNPSAWSTRVHPYLCCSIISVECFVCLFSFGHCIVCLFSMRLLITSPLILYYLNYVEDTNLSLLDGMELTYWRCWRDVLKILTEFAHTIFWSTWFVQIFLICFLISIWACVDEHILIPGLIVQPTDHRAAQASVTLCVVSMHCHVIIVNMNATDRGQTNLYGLDRYLSHTQTQYSGRVPCLGECHLRVNDPFCRFRRRVGAL